MVSALEYEGFKALKSKAQEYLRGLTNEVKKHVTKEAERIMTEISDLRGAVDQELSDDAAQNELIQQLKDQLAAAQEAAANAQAGQAGAESELNDALAAAVEVTEKLKSNDPVREEQPPAEPEEGFDPNA